MTTLFSMACGLLLLTGLGALLSLLGVV